MMVLFQNKIIYMPFLPPNARSDTIEEYEAWCGGVSWKEELIRSGDGTDIALAVAEVGRKGEGREKVVLYFQGKAKLLSIVMFLFRVSQARNRVELNW